MGCPSRSEGDRMSKERSTTWTRGHELDYETKELAAVGVLGPWHSKLREDFSYGVVGTEIVPHAPRRP